MKIRGPLYLLIGLFVWLSQSLCAQDVQKEYELQEVKVTAKRHHCSDCRAFSRVARAGRASSLEEVTTTRISF